MSPSDPKASVVVCFDNTFDTTDVPYRVAIMHMIATCHPDAPLLVLLGHDYDPNQQKKITPWWSGRLNHEASDTDIEQCLPGLIEFLAQHPPRSGVHMNRAVKTWIHEALNLASRESIIYLFTNHLFYPPLVLPSRNKYQSANTHREHCARVLARRPISAQLEDKALGENTTWESLKTKVNHGSHKLFVFTAANFETIYSWIATQVYCEHNPFLSFLWHWERHTEQVPDILPTVLMHYICRFLSSHNCLTEATTMWIRRWYIHMNFARFFSLHQLVGNRPDIALEWDYPFQKNKRLTIPGGIPRCQLEFWGVSKAGGTLRFLKGVCFMLERVKEFRPDYQTFCIPKKKSHSLEFFAQWANCVEHPDRVARLDTMKLLVYLTRLPRLGFPLNAMQFRFIRDAQRILRDEKGGWLPWDDTLNHPDWEFLRQINNSAWLTSAELHMVRQMLRLKCIIHNWNHPARWLIKPIQQIIVPPDQLMTCGRCNQKSWLSNFFCRDRLCTRCWHGQKTEPSGLLQALQRCNNCHAWFNTTCDSLPEILCGNCDVKNEQDNASLVWYHWQCESCENIILVSDFDHFMTYFIENPHKCPFCHPEQTKGEPTTNQILLASWNQLTMNHHELWTCLGFPASIHSFINVLDETVSWESVQKYYDFKPIDVNTVPVDFSTNLYCFPNMPEQVQTWAEGLSWPNEIDYLPKISVE